MWPLNTGLIVFLFVPKGDRFKKDKEREPTQDTSCCSAGCVGKLIASAICGLCFGFLLEKARGKAIEKYNQTFIKRSPFGTKRNTIKPVLRGHIWDKN
jgi:hypothetical protein